MSNKINFTCTALAGTKKQGVLKPDDNGYYTMPVGGLNMFNSVGEFYTYETAKELFSSSSAFMRRVTTGCLKGELGHPKLLPGQSMESFAMRVMQIDEKNVCVHFSEIWLDLDSVKDDRNKPIIAIMAKLAPSGVVSSGLERSLQNPKEDVCFSVRAFTKDTRVGGIKQRALNEIVTFDYVVEPGISIARKYKAPALESYMNQEFTKAQLVSAMTESADEVAMESVRTTGLELFQSLGWTFDKKDVPKWVEWK